MNRSTSAMSHRPPFTGRLARAAARHPWRVLGLWVVLVAVAYFAAGAMSLSSVSVIGNALRLRK